MRGDLLEMPLAQVDRGFLLHRARLIQAHIGGIKRASHVHAQEALHLLQDRDSDQQVLLAFSLVVLGLP